MTTSEIKSEIQKVLDEVPETVLENVLTFLKELQKQPKENIQLVSHLKQILEEDNDLLHKLAQ